MFDLTCTTCGASLTAGLCSHCQAAAFAAPAHAAEARLPLPTPAGEGALCAGSPPLDQTPLPSIRKDLPGIFGRFVPYVLVACLLTTAAFLLVSPARTLCNIHVRTISVNNLKTIGLACQGYCNTHKHLPTPKVIGADGRDVELSWRVTILPYIEQQALHDAFDLANWKDPKNFPLSDRIVHIYWCPYRDRDKEATNRTRFLQCVGPDTMYPRNAPVQMSQIADGSSNTILFAEADHRAHWPRPADLAIQPDQPLPLPEDSFYACMADGTARFFHREKTSDTILRQLMHPNDRQPAPGWDD